MAATIVKLILQSAVGKRRVVVPIAACYGVILTVGALIAAEAGHGSVVLFGLFSAPLPLAVRLIAYTTDCLGIPVPSFLMVLFFLGIPGLWSAAGFFATMSKRIHRRNYLAAFLVVHYVSAGIILRMDDYVQWKRFLSQWNSRDSDLIIKASLAAYLFGQAWLWRQFVRSFREEAEAP